MYANLMTKKIVMTKTEAKAAGKPDTTEYNTLLDLMKNFPGFQMEIVKSTAKKVDRFKGLNYDYMENYIKTAHSCSDEQIHHTVEIQRQRGQQFKNTHGLLFC